MLLLFLPSGQPSEHAAGPLYLLHEGRDDTSAQTFEVVEQDRLIYALCIAWTARKPSGADRLLDSGLSSPHCHVQAGGTMSS